MTVLPTTSGWPYTAPSSWAVHRWLSRPAAGSPAATPVRPAFWPYSGQADAGNAPAGPVAVPPGELGAGAEFAGVVALLAAMPPLVQAATRQAAAAHAIPRTPLMITLRMRPLSLGELANWTHYG